MATPTGSSVPSPPASTPSAPYPNRPNDFLDYSVWTAKRFEKWPAFEIAHKPVAERKWWWKHGYRLRDTRKSENKGIIWVCETCYLEDRHPSKCKFDATTSRSVERHLSEKHQIEV